MGARHAERTREAREKLQALGITLDAVYYTQGPYDFVDVIDAPSGEAALGFSIWYASRGYGRIQTCPAFDAGAMEQAVRGESEGKKPLLPKRNKVNPQRVTVSSLRLRR